MTKRQKRMVAVAALIIGVAAAAALGFTAFRKNMMYFYTPSDLVSGHLPAGAAVQLGGLVEKGSIERGEGLKIEFSMADCQNHVRVRYEGVLPDLFREGQGAIATGRVGPDQVFVATRILAKHDENYMPPNMARAGNAGGNVHACAPFKSVYGARDSGPGTRQPGPGTRDSGLGGSADAADAKVISTSAHSEADKQ
jgi:cytochrome c-type biogenesis protein CcmE